ncbi:hypothetical protein TeGR_g11058 [Tetraparma gracilis]|uniref:PCI domain-containing protein n=1 Tax=Tetraparma gracilis TaxID=2962635 RepID=A0ABQ6MCT2_9STRA|nr:hypothetical protein TeGR_g11058 [Tetraparma gracilis]
MAALPAEYLTFLSSLSPCSLPSPLSVPASDVAAGPAWVAPFADGDAGAKPLVVALALAQRDHEDDLREAKQAAQGGAASAAATSGVAAAAAEQQPAIDIPSERALQCLGSELDSPADDLKSLSPYLAPITQLLTSLASRAVPTPDISDLLPLLTPLLATLESLAPRTYFELHSPLALLCHRHDLPLPGPGGAKAPRLPLEVHRDGGKDKAKAAGDPAVLQLHRFRLFLHAVAQLQLLRGGHAAALQFTHALLSLPPNTSPLPPFLRACLPGSFQLTFSLLAAGGGANPSGANPQGSYPLDALHVHAYRRLMVLSFLVPGAAYADKFAAPATLKLAPNYVSAFKGEEKGAGEGKGGGGGKGDSAPNSDVGIKAYHALWKGFLPKEAADKLVEDGFGALLPALHLAAQRQELLKLAKTYSSLELASIPFDPMPALLDRGGSLGPCRCVLEGTVLSFLPPLPPPPPDSARLAALQDYVRERSWAAEASEATSRERERREQAKDREKEKGAAMVDA